MSDYKVWIKYALNDLKLAKVSKDYGIYEYAAYHVQQSIEKMLKAFLIYCNKDVPRTHNLIMLLNLCEKIDKDFSELHKFSLNKISLYAIDAKYPSDIDFSEEEVVKAIEIAEKVKEFVMKKLEKEKNK